MGSSAPCSALPVNRASSTAFCSADCAISSCRPGARARCEATFHKAPPRCCGDRPPVTCPSAASSSRDALAGINEWPGSLLSALMLQSPRQGGPAALQKSNALGKLCTGLQATLSERSIRCLSPLGKADTCSGNGLGSDAAGRASLALP